MLDKSEFHYVSGQCTGVRCKCGESASHKIGEEIDIEGEQKFFTDKGAPHFNRHNFTAYVCCECFTKLLGDAVFCYKFDPSEEGIDLDEDGYPTTYCLYKIRSWEIKDWESLKALLAYVGDNLYYNNSLRVSSDCLSWSISTGGWSGNESIIEALKKNWFFWSAFWKRSTRGGHYEFETHDKFFTNDSPESLK